jgi:hypothetical protein
MRKARVAAAAAVLAVVVVGGARAAGSFVEPTVVLQTFSGTTPGANFGWAVSELADIDGDGAAELIIGEPFSANGTTYVYSGGSGELIYRLDGEPGDWQGFAMADVGDLDGDGVNDILTGAPNRAAGHAYLYSGATGELLHTFAGVNTGDAFGWALAGAGDVDRDGVPDVIIGAPFSDQGGRDSGRAYVYSGRTYEQLRKLDAGRALDLFGSGVDGAGDLNGDGIPDLLVGARDAPGPGGPGAVYAFSGKNGRPLWRTDAPATGGQFGSFFVSSLPDLTGDGVPDVYVGDYADSAGSGRPVVLSGSDGSEVFAWPGTPGAGAGPGRGAGDVNGDGFEDLAIGHYQFGADDAGRVEVRSGADGSLLRSITSTTPGENFGFDAVGIGDVNDDGRPDLLVSAATGETVYVIAG